MAAAPAGAGGELFELRVCPWTPENPRHDHRTANTGRGNTDEAPRRMSGRISMDGVRSWSGRIALQDNIAADNVKHPNLPRLPSGEILFSFTARDTGAGELRVYQKRSRDECESWDALVRISPPGGLWFTNAGHAFRHSSGRLILPTHWGTFYGPGDHYQALVLYSDDEGKAWRPGRIRMDLPKRGAEEPAMVELEDGSILALLRTPLGKIYRSVSRDRGESWAAPEETALPSPSSASRLKRIPMTGELLFVWNNAVPYALRPGGGANFHQPRNPLTSAISRNEGRTWSNFKDIERREGYISRDRLREILETAAVHILQPEPAVNGGILETVKWAAMAELYHVLLAPHQACGPVSLAACAHIDACVPDLLIQECNLAPDSAFNRELYPKRPAIENGYLKLPEGPGLGVELDEEAAARYPWKPFDRPVVIQHDGAIGLE